jgi:hypothetical protein
VTEGQAVFLFFCICKECQYSCSSGGIIVFIVKGNICDPAIDLKVGMTMFAYLPESLQGLEVVAILFNENEPLF